MIPIRRVIPECHREELNERLTHICGSAIIFPAYKDALVGFNILFDSDEPRAVAVYDEHLAVTARAREIQAETGCDDDQAMDEALDERSHDSSYYSGTHQGAPFPDFLSLGGEYHGLTMDSYQANAVRTAQGMEDPNMLANWGLGLAGEAGEVIELIKKHLYHGKELDKDALIKELGDVMWYVAAICSQVGLSLEDVAERNVAKLSARYPNGFVKGGGKRDD
jgi:NTP pyrophosphatase (non-canonical NTP hydrolase)